MFKITKDPNAVLDYGFDWSGWLQDGETISDSEWSVDGTGLTIESDTNDDTSTTVWLSGGTVRSYPYTVTNRITTSAGRTDDRSIQVYVAER